MKTIIELSEADIKEAIALFISSVEDNSFKAEHVTLGHTSPSGGSNDPRERECFYAEVKK